jgi:hypothetical protein
MNPTVAALLAIALTIVLSIIGGTWHLSNKIGDLRVSIAQYHEQSKARDSKVDEMWNWWIELRRPASENGLAQHAGH